MKKENKKRDKKKNIKMTNVEKKILLEEKKIEREEKALRKEEKNIELKEEQLASQEKELSEIRTDVLNEKSELEKIEQIEKEIKSEVGEHPLAKITFKDFIKGSIGAFIGLAVHYTFIYGVKSTEHLSISRATILFPLTFVVGLLFIYATGFRKVEDPKILMFMPVRLLILYFASLIMSIVVLFIFYPEFGHDFWESYKMVAGVMLAAVVGACTADLFGKE